MADDRVVVPVSLEVDGVSAKNLDLGDLSKSLQKYFTNMTKSMSNVLGNIDTTNMSKELTTAFNNVIASIADATKAQENFNNTVNEVTEPNADFDKWKQGLEAELQEVRDKFDNIALSPEYNDTKSQAYGGDEDAQAKLDVMHAKMDEYVARIKEIQAELQATPLEINVGNGASLDGVTSSLDTFETKMNEVDATYAQLISLMSQQPYTAEFEQAAMELGEIGDKIEELNSKSVNMNLEKVNSVADELELQLDDVIAKMQQLSETGQAFKLGNMDSGASDALSQNISALADELRNALASIRANGGKENVMPNVGDKKFTKSVNNASNALKGFGDVAKRIKASISGLFKNGIGGVKKFTSGLKGGFSQLLKYALGIQAVFSMIRKLRSAFIESFQAMGKQVPSVGEQINSFKNSLTQVKGALATAFQPIASVIIPLLVQLMGYINSAMTALGHFFATFTGQKKIYKYTAAQNDYTKSVKGTGSAAKKATKDLMGFDEINRLSDKDTGGGGGGGASGLDTGSYEAIETKLSSLAKKIKEAWAVGDFTQIGLEAGNALKSVLDSIPWDKLQATAEKFGKSVATFINGFVSAPGLFREIGVSLGEAVNTLIALASGFVDNLNFEDIGKALSDAIMGFFETTNFAKAGATISSWFKGVLTVVATMLKETDFQVVGQKIADFLVNLDIPGIALKLAQVIWEIIKAAFTIGATLIKEAPLETALLAVFAAFKWTKLGSFVGKKLMGAISKGLAKEVGGKAIGLILKTALGQALAVVAAAIIGFNIGKWLYEHVAVVREVADKVVEIFFGIVEGIQNAWSTLVDIVSGVINAVVTFISTKFTEIKNFISNVMFGIKMGVSNAWDAITTKIASVITGIRDKIVNIWNGIKEFISNTISNIKTNVSDTFTSIKETISTIFENIKTKISNIWTSIKTKITDTVTGIKNAIATQFQNAYNKITGIFNGIATFFSGIWNKVSNTFSALGTRIGDAISGAVKTAINGVLGMIEKVINKGIGLINGAIGAINKLPGVSVSKLDTLSLPRLAQGAVLPPNQPFAAIVGDQKHGTNVETPLATIQEAVANVMDGQLDAIAAMAEAIVMAINNKDMSVVIGDDAIGRAATRYNRRQAIMKG